jgi:cytidyltransferase-like protein
MPKKVFVSGCFDMLHSGHIAFFREAASYGDLYVALGADQTVYDLKGRLPVNTEDERLFMVQAVSYVKQAFVSQGSGMLDFENELRSLSPDMFIVNEDGNIPAKQQLCTELGIEYMILKRDPHADLPRRSTTSLRTVEQVPYRIDLAGGWLDQPYVSKFHSGAVITISIHPTVNFNERSGMASSTRRSAIDLWGPKLPPGDSEKLAKILFCYDNPPGTKEVSGSQDSIGIAMPGLNKSYYEGAYWPSQIDKVRDEMTMQFIEQSLYLVPLGPRGAEYSVLSNTNIDVTGAKALADATDACWNAILSHNITRFGNAIRLGFESQVAMFPNMMNKMLGDLINRYHDTALGWKVSGAGGGGYLILVSDKPIEQGFQIVIRRPSD